MDIYELHKAVEDCGGYNNICGENAWISICRKLGFESCPEVASIICAKYRELILPIDNFYDPSTGLVIRLVSLIF